jgi:hypothetical protein
MLALCPRCGARLVDLSQPCPECGAVISSQSQLPTMAATAGAPPHSGPIGRLDTPASSSRLSFTPGEILAGRYRIVGLLGRGGMGDVYRADDLQLGQPVSLKFLPPALAATAGALERFRTEVRNARQVAHPNVCRVYDIGEARGLTFLTMEFVDGEDLASLLRRIGSLPTAKANEVARQLCAGLAAAHDKGVLHRDLKPSNVMIDGDGRVRITDFGLAVRTGESPVDFAGTPAYMAPEQFAGGPVTTRTDLYSLGLILFEIYSGRRPFEASSVAEWKSRHTQTTPTLPTGRDVVLDEAVERAILRCLEKDPSRRPATALQLAAALPGGDPLAAALAAGETPSPEMVAAAGGEGALAPRAAWALAAGLLLGVAALVAVTPFSSDMGLAPMTVSPEVLSDRAAGMLDRFGYGRHALDRESWIERLYAPMLHIARTTPSTEWRAMWRSLGPPILLVYRQSPRWMGVRDPAGRISADEPPFEVSDMAMIRVSADGHLRTLRAEPPQVDTMRTAAAFAWGTLFDAAGFDSSRFQRVEPTWVPPSASNARAEWVGTVPELPGIPLRVAAAAYRGRPVYFDILGPWSRPTRMERPPTVATQRIAGVTIGGVSLVSSVMALILWRRNRRLGRGDARGASRFAGALFALAMVRWLAGAHHVPAPELEAGSFLAACASSLLTAAIAAVLYLAIEPYVRRRMPELMIGWARVIEGRLRDPRVGRDILAGALLGTAAALLVHASNALPTWVPILGQTTVPPDTGLLQGGRHAIGGVIGMASVALVSSLSTFFVLFLLRLVLKPDWVSLVAMMVLLSVANLGGENVVLETPFAVVQGVIAGWALGRLGLLAAATMFLYRVVLGAVPLPIHAGSPYALTSILVIGLMLALAAYAMRISVGTRGLFSSAALD